jgi:5-methylthioadenosine/S-adenosylhomocysteine deaminase
MNQHTFDILVTNGTILTMDNHDSIIENGAVLIENGRIAALGPSSQLENTPVRKVLNASGGLILPGLVNTHTHAAMTLFRGLADDLPLMTWLNDYIFPAEAQLNWDKVYWGTLLGCAEMIMSGTTCFCDMYLFEDAVAQAATDARMRAVVGEVLFDFPSPNYGTLEEGFTYTQQLIDKWHGDPLISIAVEPHSPYLCAPPLLQKVLQISQDHELLMVMHVSETHQEVAEMKKRYGHTPVRHLAELGMLAPTLLACHCVVLTAEDIELLRTHGVKVAHNAESNMKLASGVAPIPQLLEEKICVGLGTDGCASNNNLDLLQEMDTVAKLHKVWSMDPTVLDARSVLRMATIDGAKALGLDHLIGSLETGKQADLIVIDRHKPHLTPMYNPISHLVYAACGSDVMAAIIQGQLVMEDRQLLTLDIEKIMAKAAKVARGLANP